MAKLNKTQIDNLLGKSQPQIKEIADGNNLYLIVTKAGSCKFKYRIRKNNKASWVVIGDYPDITLNEARRKALEIRAQMAEGINPNEEKKRKKARQIKVSELFERYVIERLPIVRTKERSRNEYLTSVKRNIIAIIGDELVTNITDDFIRERLLLPKIENNSASVARLILINIKVLLDFAVELKILEYNPATKIKAANIYRDKPRTRHLDHTEIKQLLNFIYSTSIKTQNKFAFHLSLMLLTRKSELIHATWGNVDFEQSRFTIYESKMNSQLVIPLPRQALSMFEKLKMLSRGSKYIFPGNTHDSPISAGTLNWSLRNFNKATFGDNKANYVTVHDLRRTGATHLGELGYPSDYIEVALNHSKGAIKQVYQRSQFIEQRKEMLQRWADILDELIDRELLQLNNSVVVV